MNKQDFNNAFKLFTSGVIAKNGKEVLWKFRNCFELYIEFPTNTPDYAVARNYWENGNVFSQCEYTNGMLHGKSIRWYQSGSMMSDETYENGLLNGRRTTWNADGVLVDTDDFEHGKCVFHNGEPVEEMDIKTLMERMANHF